MRGSSGKKVSKKIRPPKFPTIAAEGLVFEEECGQECAHVASHIREAGSELKLQVTESAITS
jgi:hypothetical protein